MSDEVKQSKETPVADATSAAAKPTRRLKKKKAVKQVSLGRAYIHASYNNTIVTLTDDDGNVLAWASAGMCGFKGPKKSTPYAASVIVKMLLKSKRDWPARCQCVCSRYWFWSKALFVRCMPMALMCYRQRFDSIRITVVVHRNQDVFSDWVKGCGDWCWVTTPVTKTITSHLSWLVRTK